MEHQHPLPTSQLLPFLPLELKHHILRSCDPSTLANTSRVSLAILELSSPILYQDIEIVGLKNVEKLFCKRIPELDHPHLHVHLSLTNVRNLTVIATEDRVSVLHLSSRWPSSTSPLPIDLLTARPIGIGEDDIDSEFDAWWEIYQFVDTKAVHITGLLPSSPRRSVPRFHLGNRVHFLWNNLVELKITLALNGNEEMFVTRSLCLDRHPVVTFDLSFDLSSIWGDAFSFDALSEIQEVEMESGVKGWVVFFESERDKNKFWEQLERYWRGSLRDEVEFEECRQGVRLEVVA